MAHKTIFNIAAVLAIALALNSATAFAYFYNITYICENNVCVEEEAATWHIEIKNEGRHEQEYTAIELFDAINNSPVAFLKIPFYPQRDDRGDLIVVKPNEKARVNITGKIPKANIWRSLVYYPCFTTTITDSYTIGRDNVYESRKCYFDTNETMEVVECVKDDNCNFNEKCMSNSCAKIKCGSCQYAKNHECADFQCCGPEQCGYDETCLNNTCIRLGCEPSQYILNRTCANLTCRPNEIIFNQSCKKLDCRFDEYIHNDTCRLLNCSSSEYVLNHTCAPLQCRQDELAANHSCSPLNCAESEIAVNHVCSPLNCYFFQDTISHECVNNKRVVAKLAIEIVIILIIALFLALDFMKYEKRRDSTNIQIKKK